MLSTAVYSKTTWYILHISQEYAKFLSIFSKCLNRQRQNRKNFPQKLMSI